MNSQKRETAKSKPPKPKRGGQPLLSRVRPLSALLPEPLMRVVKPSLWNFPKQRYFEAPQRARTFSVPVKLREPPKPPVEIIQIHSNPSKSPIPPIPQNITFEMLANLYSDELLLTEINNLEKNAEEIANNIIKNDNFEDTIARLISECKEKVRLMLWNNFYTTLTGNAKTLSGGNGCNGGNTDDYDAWYGDDAKSSKPIVVKWRFRLCVFSFVSRVLNYCIKLLTTHITDTESVAPPARRHDRQYYIDKMKTMKATILNDLRKSGIIPEQLKRIEANFFLVPTDKVELAMKVQDILESHSLSELYTAFPPDIRNSGVYNRLYQPFTKKET